MNRMNRPWTFPQFLVRTFVFFIGTGIISFSLIGIMFRGLQQGLPAGSWFGLKWGSVCMFAFAIICYFAQQRVVKKYGCLPDYNPRQTRTMIVHVSVQKALALIEAGLMGLPRVIPDSLTRSEGTIRAVTRVNFRSFAEEISISGTPGNGDKTLLVIESKPRSWGTMVDYGKGIENVEEIARAIPRWLGPNVHPT